MLMATGIRAQARPSVVVPRCQAIKPTKPTLTDKPSPLQQLGSDVVLSMDAGGSINLDHIESGAGGD